MDHLSLRSWRASDGERQTTAQRLRGYALVLRRTDDDRNQVVSTVVSAAHANSTNHSTRRTGEMLLIHNRRVNWETARSASRAIRRTNAVPRRSEDWNVGLAEDLRDPALAREFLLAAIDEGVDIQVALGKVIRAMGVKEFAVKVRMASPNVLRSINPRHNPTQATLDRLLKPFGLSLSLAPIKSKSRQTAA